MQRPLPEPPAIADPSAPWTASGIPREPSLGLVVTHHKHIIPGRKRSSDHQNSGGNF